LEAHAQHGEAFFEVGFRDVTGDHDHAAGGVAAPTPCTRQYRTSFPVFLEKTEFRFTTRDKDHYKILLKSCGMNPLRRRAGINPG